MKVVNQTSLPVLTMPGIGPGDSPVLTIIVKATFDVGGGQVPLLSEEQMPIFVSDELNDAENVSSPRFEDDVAVFKPRADVVVVGKAIVPGGKHATVLDVGFQVGPLTKMIKVCGDRFWLKKGLFGALAPSITVPFTEMELLYEKSFGGMDQKWGDFCPQNLVGCGLYGKKSKPDDLEKKPLPNLEDPANLIKSWKDRPSPVGFGFIGKAWEPRLAMMGTFDEQWEKERSPERPADFSFEFYNAAPRDQQVAGYLQGNEAVELLHLTPEGRSTFQLPGIQPIVTVGESWEDAGMTKVTMKLDTLCLMPAEDRFYQVWRGLIPVRDLSAKEIKRLDVTL